MKHLTEKSDSLKLFNKLNEGVDKTAQAKEIMASLGINEIYFSDEHKPSREYDVRIPNAYKYVDFYGYASINHNTLGNFYISYKIGGRKNIIDASGFPWEGIEKDTTKEQKSFIENNYEALSQLFILCRGQVSVSLNENVSRNIMKTLTESVNYKVFKNEKEIENEFDGKAYKFYDNEIDHNINYIGDMKAGNCKQNAILAKENDPEDNPEVYLGYIVMKDKNGKLCGIRHYFNVNNGLVMEHTPVRDTQLYKSGELQYYIGEEI